MIWFNRSFFDPTSMSWLRPLLPPSSPHLPPSSSAAIDRTAKWINSLQLLDLCFGARRDVKLSAAETRRFHGLMSSRQPTGGKLFLPLLTSETVDVRNNHGPSGGHDDSLPSGELCVFFFSVKCKISRVLSGFTADFCKKKNQKKKPRKQKFRAVTSRPDQKEPRTK